jgi:tripartite-type tricarboxylate transporter receptor subunit TctC
MTQVFGLMFGLLALLTAASPAAQTTYPEKPIRMVVGFPPGSQPDTVARLLGQKFAEAWGKPVLIDNTVGAGGNIATERVAKAAPDGYTLGLLTQGQIVTNPILYKLAYDPVKDFAPVSQVTVSPTILVVHNAVSAKNHPADRGKRLQQYRSGDQAQGGWLQGRHDRVSYPQRPEGRGGRTHADHAIWDRFGK